MALCALAAVPGVALAGTGGSTGTASTGGIASPKGTVSPTGSPGRAVPVTVAACKAQRMTFDMAPYSRTATEVSGPRLTARELLVYQHRVFQIGSVHGRSFTLVKVRAPALLRAPVRLSGKACKKPAPAPALSPAPVRSKLFRNGATTIERGHAYVLRGPVVLVVKPARLPGLALSHGLHLTGLI